MMAKRLYSTSNIRYSRDMNKQGVLKVRLKTQNRDFKEIFTKLEALGCKPTVNLDEKPSDYLYEILEKTIAFLGNVKSEQSSLETTVPGGAAKETPSLNPINALAANCIFRVEFSKEDKVICMRDFDAKGSLHKMPTQACEKHWLIQKIRPEQLERKSYYSGRVEERDSRDMGYQKTSSVPLISSRPAVFCPKRQILQDSKKCEVCKDNRPTEYELCQEGKQGKLPQKW